MRKPLNRVAIAMWVLAALSVMYLIWFVWSGNVRDVVWGIIQGLTNGVAPLVAFGVIIELVDQIRWNALPPELRNRR